MADSGFQLVAAALAVSRDRRCDLDMLVDEAPVEELRDAFALLAGTTSSLLAAHSGADRVVAHMRREAARAAGGTDAL